MQKREQENNGAREFHRKKVGAGAGTRKTCGSLRCFSIRQQRVPDTFEQTVQSVFNQHCVQSSVFKQRRVAANGLFSSRHEGTSAIGAVYRERAKAWVIAKNRNSVDL